MTDDMIALCSPIRKPPSQLFVLGDLGQCQR
jgi:hypothetical protein